MSEANLRDPEGPAVWGYLALMYLQQGREADADKALTQAHRHGLSKPEVLVDIADQYQALGRFSKAEGLLGKALIAGLDTVKVTAETANCTGVFGLEALLATSREPSIMLDRQGRIL